MGFGKRICRDEATAQRVATPLDQGFDRFYQSHPRVRTSFVDGWLRKAGFADAPVCTVVCGPRPVAEKARCGEKRLIAFALQPDGMWTPVLILPRREIGHFRQEMRDMPGIAGRTSRRESQPEASRGRFGIGSADRRVGEIPGERVGVQRFRFHGRASASWRDDPVRSGSRVVQQKFRDFLEQSRVFYRLPVTHEFDIVLSCYNQTGNEGWTVSSQQRVAG